MTTPSSQPRSNARFWRQLSRLTAAGRVADAEQLLRNRVAAVNCPEARLTLAAVLAEQERFHEALCELTQVLDAAQASGRRDLLEAVHANLAAVYRELGEFDLARRFQQRALNYQDDYGPEELLQLANDALAARRWALAESLLQAADELSADDSPLLADIAATRGVCAGLKGQPAAGLRWLRGALACHREQEDWGAAGRDLLNLAALYHQLGRVDREQRLLATATRCLSRAGLPRTLQRAQAWSRRVEQLLALRAFDARRN